jgi:hypothetical protein
MHPAMAVTPAAAPCTRHGGHICHGSRTRLGALHLPWRSHLPIASQNTALASVSILLPARNVLVDFVLMTQEFLSALLNKLQDGTKHPHQFPINLNSLDQLENEILLIRLKQSFVVASRSLPTFTERDRKIISYGRLYDENRIEGFFANRSPFALAILVLAVQQGDDGILQAIATLELSDRESLLDFINLELHSDLIDAYVSELKTYSLTGTFSSDVQAISNLLNQRPATQTLSQYLEPTITGTQSL